MADTYYLMTLISARQETKGDSFQSRRCEYNEPPPCDQMIVDYFSHGREDLSPPCH